MIAAVVRPDGADYVWIATDDAASPRRLRSFIRGRPTKDDRPVPGDWAGDGADTPGVVRAEGADLVWRWTDDLSGADLDHEFRWGRPTKDDIPVAGRWPM